MKKVISTVIVIVMLLMASGNLGVFAADDIMLSAYLDVLNSHSENGMMPRYLIYDIDGNGVSELLIMNGTCEADKQLYIYAYLDKNVCCLGEIGAWHAWYQKIPNKNGLLLFYGRATEGTLISIVSNKLYTEEGYEYTEDMIDIGFTDKSDISGFGNFNYIPVNNVSIASFNAGIGRGIDYYNKGLYYEAINEIQWFCDANWYSMTAEQQQNALYYLNNAKSKLADYSFTTGKNYYNKGLYYEAQKEFSNALSLYPEYSSQWQSANDYLYNTNERIKRLNVLNSYNGNYVAYYTSWGYKFNVSITNTTENSLTARLWVSNSDVIIAPFRLTKKANGSYYGEAMEDNFLFSYYIKATLWLDSPNCIVLNDGYESIRLYKE